MRVDAGELSCEISDIFQKLESKPEDPKDSSVYGYNNKSTMALVMIFPLPSEEAMPYDSPRAVIDGIHHAMGEDQGLVEVELGKTARGRRFIYSVVKTLKQPSGVQYVLAFHLERPNDTLCIQAFFDEIGTTGLRDTAVYEHAKREGYVTDGFDGWAKDPYDETYTRGALKNLSESKNYDSAFPEHPLTQLHNFVDNFTRNN